MAGRAILVTFLALLAAGTVSAEDVVVLKSGKRIPGKVTDGFLAVEVSTSNGTARIPWNEIERIDRSSWLESRYEARAKKLGANDAKGHFLLALWCRRQGLAGPMRTELEKVLKIDPNHPGARAALGYEKVKDRWVAGAPLLAAKGFVRQNGRWILKEEARYEDLVKARKVPLTKPEEKAENLLSKCVSSDPRIAKYARQVLAGLSFDDARIPLYRALGRRDPKLRAFAARVLGRYRDPESARPLLRSAVLDTSEDVREAAVDSLASLGEPAVLFPLVRALGSEHTAVRMNAEAAIGRLGDVRGIGYLVTRYAEDWGPSARVNLSVTNQVSYVRDFDVEIAQASQIGDPVVGILREGVVLDVRILGINRRLTTVERQVIRSALSRLSGVDEGDHPAAWAAWWKKNRDRLLAKAK